MNEGNQHNWPSFEPADLDQLIKYKRGELSEQEAYKVELFLSEFDPDLLDDLSITDLEALRGTEFKPRPTQSRTTWSSLRIAASIAVVVGILGLVYMLTQDKLEGDKIVQHETQIDEINEAHDESTEEIVTDEAMDEAQHDEIALEESASMEEDIESNTVIMDDEVEDKSTDLLIEDEVAEHKKDKGSDNNESPTFDADDAVTEETESVSASRYKIAQKDAVSKTEAPVVYTIIEKYNNPKDKPADIPKTARAFAKSTVGVSKNTYRRKVSPSFPGGDVALIKWFEDNYTNLIEEEDKPFKLTFKVTKKAKLVDPVFSEIDKNQASKFNKKLKDMPAWNKPESSYDPLDIYYSIWIAPK